MVFDQVLTTSSLIHLDTFMSLVLTLAHRLVSIALQSSSFPAVLGLEGTDEKAEFVGLFYNLHWFATKTIMEMESALDSHINSAVELVKISSLKS